MCSPDQTPETTQLLPKVKTQVLVWLVGPLLQPCLLKTVSFIVWPHFRLCFCWWKVICNILCLVYCQFLAQKQASIDRGLSHAFVPVNIIAVLNSVGSVVQITAHCLHVNCCAAAIFAAVMQTAQNALVLMEKTSCKTNCLYYRQRIISKFSSQIRVFIFRNSLRKVVDNYYK